MSADPIDQDGIASRRAENMAQLLTIIRECETDQTLDWIEDWATRRGYDSVGVRIALKTRRADLANRPRLLF